MKVKRRVGISIGDISCYGKDCVDLVTATWPTYHLSRAGGLSDHLLSLNLYPSQFRAHSQL